MNLRSVKLPCVFALCLMVPLGFASKSHAHGHTSAGGAFIEDDTIVDEHDALIMPETAKISKTLEEDGSKIEAMACVKGPTLKAMAFASRPDSIESQYPRSGAEAIWEDALEFQNADLYLGVFGTFNPVAWFRPEADGIGARGDADFSVSVVYSTGQVTYANKSADFRNTIYDGSGFKFNIPISVNAITAGVVDFRMALSVGTQSTLAPGQQALVDFSHTAYLPPIYIGDANGNPIPELAGLRLVGSSGWEYPVTFVQKTPGDYNGDGVVNAADYTVWRDTFGETGLTLDADGDGNRIIDEHDYDVWRFNFGTVASFAEDLGPGAGSGAKTPSDSKSAVPEPGTLLLFISVAGLSVGKMRRRQIADQRP